MKKEMETGFGPLAVLTREMLVDAGANRAFRWLCRDGTGAACAGPGAPPQAPVAAGHGQDERTAA